MGASLAIYGLAEMVGFRRSHYGKASMEILGGYKKRAPWCYLFLILGTLYFLSRACLIVGALVSLRDMPTSAFEGVPWLQFLPKL